jgi:hypothetical protein
MQTDCSGCCRGRGKYRRLKSENANHKLKAPPAFALHCDRTVKLLRRDTFSVSNRSILTTVSSKNRRAEHGYAAVSVLTGLKCISCNVR